MRAKRSRSTVEASKYTSLERLKQIQRDNYVGENGVDYCKDSVDQLIWEKQQKKADEAMKAEVDKWDEYEEFMQAESRRNR